MTLISPREEVEVEEEKVCGMFNQTAGLIARHRNTRNTSLIKWLILHGTIIVSCPFRVKDIAEWLLQRPWFPVSSFPIQCLLVHMQMLLLLDSHRCCTRGANMRVEIDFMTRDLRYNLFANIQANCNARFLV